MTRSTITPDLLRAKGYEAFEFSDWTLERACEYIRNGCECKLKPQETGHMVGTIVIRQNGHVYEYDVFARNMTPEELATYHDWMVEERKQMEKRSAKIRAKQIAKMRRH